MGWFSACPWSLWVSQRADDVVPLRSASGEISHTASLCYRQGAPAGREQHRAQLWCAQRSPNCSISTDTTALRLSG
eukprot:COSAG01_NODE_66_length_29241_cov_17.772768_4_plen_76_part_00